MDSAHPYALRAGTVVGGYKLVRVLGAGGFGVTYEARHRESNAHVALKEYLPAGYCMRATGSTAVQSAPGEHGDTFRWGRERFMKEAETLARLEHPSIVKVSEYFEANNTAYMALAYEEGGTFGDWLKQLGRTPTQTELDRFAWSLTRALTQVHSLFLTHRDIKPDNIMLRADLTPVLIDFGAAKGALAGQSRVAGRASPAPAGSYVVVSDGYSPPEQYVSGEARIGPWSDVYALAATLYRGVTGTPPPPANERLIEDDYRPVAEMPLGDEWRPQFLAAIDGALALKREQRPQSALEFRRALGVTAPERKLSGISISSPTIASPPPRATLPRDRPAERPKGGIYISSRTIALGLVTVVAASLVAGLVLLAPQPPIAKDTPRLDVSGLTPLSEPLTETAERLLRPKDSFRECETCPEMVVVPAGSFTMGSPAGEPERWFGEDPQRKVTLPQPFAVGRFAVTFAEWDACVTDGGCEGYRPNDHGWGRGRQPVITVDWNDAKTYVAWLSGKTGKAYRLLSEAEREYVTRAGTTTPFWWGSTISTDQANYNGNLAYAGGPKGQYRQRTVPVDTFQPNPWGLYQVHGNVWEWTEDCLNASYTGAPIDGSTWTAGDCDLRVARGGSWDYSPENLRAAKRMKGFTDTRKSNFGFRVARTLLAR